MIIPIITGTILFYLINIVFNGIIEFRKELRKTYSLLIYSQNKLQSYFNYNGCDDQFISNISILQLDIRKQWSELESKYCSVKFFGDCKIFRFLGIPTNSDFKKIAVNLLYLSNSNLFYNPKNSIICKKAQSDLENRIKLFNELMELFEKYNIKKKESR